MRRSILAILVSALALISFNSPAAEKIKDTEWQVQYVTEGKFEEIKENIQLAITEQGLVIDNVARVGMMLERTAKDLGYKGNVYKHGDVFEFCSAKLSREMMDADPTNLVFCPYTIYVYALADQPNKVYVGYRRPPIVGSDASKQALRNIDKLLAGIVSEALTW